MKKIIDWFQNLFQKEYIPSPAPVEITREAIDANVPPIPAPKKPFSNKQPKVEDKIMKMSAHGLELLTKWEGFETNVYKDSAGLPTIGVGHLLTKDELYSGKILIEGNQVKFHNGLTRQQVVNLLGEDIRRYEETVRTSVKVKLEQFQFDALVSFCFNVGQRAFANSTLLKKVNANAFNEVPEQFSRWNKVGGRAVAGLTNRRNNEIKLWEGKI